MKVYFCPLAAFGFFVVVQGMGCSSGNTAATKPDKEELTSPIERYNFSSSDRNADGERLLWQVESVGFSPDGQTLIAVCNDYQKVKSVFWDAKTGKLIKDMPDVFRVAYSTDGKLVALDLPSKIDLIETGSGNKKTTLTKRGGLVAFTPDSKFLVTMGAENRNVVSLWDVQTGALVRHSPEVKITPRRVALRPRTSTIVLIHNEGKSIDLWDSSKEGPLTPLAKVGTGYSMIAFSPTEEILAAVRYGSDSADLIDLKTGEIKTTPKQPRAIKALDFSPDGKRLALGCSDVHVLDASGYQQLFSLEVKGVGLSTVAFSPDGKYLAAGSGEKVFGRVTVWELPAGNKPVQTK
jgi:WD40 repeat protein